MKRSILRGERQHQCASFRFQRRCGARRLVGRWNSSLLVIQGLDDEVAPPGNAHVRAGGRRGHLDHPAAQRHASSGRSRQEIWHEPRGGRALRDCGDTEREARSGPAGPDAVAWFRRAQRQNVRPGSRHRGRRQKLQFRRRGERDRPAGHVGEMGVPGVVRGLDQPDARPDRNDSGGARRPSRPPKAIRPARPRWNARQRCSARKARRSRHRCSATSRRANRSKPTM